MKKLILPCMLAISLMVTAQFANLNSTIDLESNNDNVELATLIENLPSTYAGEEEQEVEFDFTVSEYLPGNFDEYKGMIEDESFLLVTEETPFNFEVDQFLPSNFDVYEGMIIEEEIMDEEIPFNFNLLTYLPSDFDVYEGMIIEEEVLEEEILFDFDVNAYLPLGFDPHKKVDIDNL